MGSWNVRNRRLRERLAGSRRVGRVRGDERRAADPRRARQRGRVPHRLRRRLRRHVLPLLRPGDAALVDLLGRQPAPRRARPAGLRLVLDGDVGVFEGDGHVRGPADPRALHLVGRDDADAALGAGVLRRRRRDVGDELGDGLHTRRRRADERCSSDASARPGRLQACREARPARAERSPSATRCSSGTTSRRPTRPSRPAIRELARDASARRGPVGRARALGELGFVILHRCGESFYFLLVCTWRNENELWETVWAKDGDGDRPSEPWPLEGTHRPTFCVWELGASPRARAWSRFLRSPRATATRGSTTCATPSTGSSREGRQARPPTSSTSCGLGWSSRSWTAGGERPVHAHGLAGVSRGEVEADEEARRALAQRVGAHRRLGDEGRIAVVARADQLVRRELECEDAELRRGAPARRPPSRRTSPGGGARRGRARAPPPGRRSRRARGPPLRTSRAPSRRPRPSARAPGRSALPRAARRSPRSARASTAGTRRRAPA